MAHIENLDEGKLRLLMDKIKEANTPDLPKFKLTTRNENDRYYAFICPGCKDAHQVKVPFWSFNESLDKPTISPSLLVHGKTHCHSFIKDGTIQFLGDCEHELKNQMVEIPDWDASKTVYPPYWE